MGENFVLQQIQNFERGRDLALDEMGLPTLFERPEVFEILYTAHPTGGAVLREAEMLCAVAVERERKVCLARGHRQVGQIDGDGAIDLWNALHQRGASGVAKVRVAKLLPVSGVAIVRIVEE